MSNNMLGNLPLSEVQGPRDDFEQKLAGPEGTVWLSAFKRFLRKENTWSKEPQTSTIVVDCDARPRIPSSLKLEGKGTEHRQLGKITLKKRDGKLYANGVEVIRFLSPNQKDGKIIRGDKLRKELQKMQVLNACILDALLAHPELIPDEWKNGATYFWATIFSDADGDLCVEYLYWSGGSWRRSNYWLEGDWLGSGPAAVLASTIGV